MAKENPAISFLKSLFAGFLRNRHFARHFRRLALFESLVGTDVSRELPAHLSTTLVASANADSAALLARFGSHADGLLEDEADAVRARVGPNEVEHEKPLRWWVHLWHCYRNPFNLLLTLLAVISWLTADLEATVVIGSMVLLSTLLRFWQEARSGKAAEALKAMISTTATVSRRAAQQGGPAQRVELPIRELVPGDVVILSAGDMIPADCRVLAAKDLFVAQAAMTGESLPVEKFAAQRAAGAVNPLELDNILFMGTNVVSGAASAVVLATGNDTYFGALASRVTAADRAPTSFQAGVNNVSWLLIRFMFVMAPLVLVINGFTKHDWMQALLFALSIAVGLTPEMLPMIVTSTLAKGAVFLSRKKVIVKRLDAIQNFGAMDVLCTDKTGTLTQDRIFLSRHIDVWGETSYEVLDLAYLNSYYQTGLKNLLDVAVLEHAEVHRELNVATEFRKVEEGVLEGRRTFANTLKYIKMTASSNFGNVFSVLVASAFIPFLPMLPMQLLMQNLLYDISQIAIPFDHVDEELLRAPQRWQPGDIGRFMLFFGPLSSLFDIATFVMMWFVFGADTPEEQAMFQSGWFIVGLLTQTLIVHMIRTARVPFLQSRAAPPLLVMTGVIMAVGVFLPMGPLAHNFKFQPLPPLYFAFLPLIVFAYMGLTQVVKGFYRRRWGWQ